MTDIDEVEIISTGGVPFYYHNNSGGSRDDETYLLQASFITALSQFATELNNGQIKLISMERKHYLLTKSATFTVIFTSHHENGPAELISYEPQIQQVRDYLDEKLMKFQIDLTNPNNPNLDTPMQQFDDYLKEQNIVTAEESYDLSGFRKEMNKFIFRSVGYTPGVCNIGRAERMRRLAFGLIFFTLSFIGYSLILLLDLSNLFILLLAIPNFLGFLGLFQFFYRFCTTNALNQEYDMN